MQGSGLLRLGQAPRDLAKPRPEHRAARIPGYLSRLLCHPFSQENRGEVFPWGKAREAVAGAGARP